MMWIYALFILLTAEAWGTDTGLEKNTLTHMWICFSTCACVAAVKKLLDRNMLLFFHKEYVTTFTSFYIVRMCHLCYFIVYVNML